MTQATEKKTERPLLRTIQGVVASDKGNKTIKVVVNYQTRHPKYGKYLKCRTVLHAHDEKNDAKEGDTVEIRECPPRSALKRRLPCSARVCGRAQNSLRSLRSLRSNKLRPVCG